MNILRTKFKGNGLWAVLDLKCKLESELFYICFRVVNKKVLKWLSTSLIKNELAIVLLLNRKLRGKKRPKDLKSKKIFAYFLIVCKSVRPIRKKNEAAQSFSDYGNWKI